MSEAEATECRKQAEVCRQEAEKAVSPLDKMPGCEWPGYWMNLALSVDRRKQVSKAASVGGLFYL
jgi:hypothetical protein